LVDVALLCEWKRVYSLPTAFVQGGLIDRLSATCLGSGRQIAEPFYRKACSTLGCRGDRADSIRSDAGVGCHTVGRIAAAPGPSRLCRFAVTRGNPLNIEELPSMDRRSFVCLQPRGMWTCGRNDQAALAGSPSAELPSLHEIPVDRTGSKISESCCSTIAGAMAIVASALTHCLVLSFRFRLLGASSY
jgi:hypothetical protein